MKPHLATFSAFAVFVLLWAVTHASSICYGYNGGFFYMANRTYLSCKQVCEPFGGFNAKYSRHSGNAVGRHFTPNNVNTYNWEPIECSSTDGTPSNYGANNLLPDPNWSHMYCFVLCACNEGTDDCEGNVCSDVDEGGPCSLRYRIEDTVLYLNGTCSASGECFAPNMPCVSNSSNPCSASDQGFTDEEGNCITPNVDDGTECPLDGVVSGCSKCFSGVCTTAVNQTCNDGDTNTSNDVCLSDGSCAGQTLVPISTPTASPVSPAESPIVSPVSPVASPIASPAAVPVAAPTATLTTQSSGVTLSLPAVIIALVTAVPILLL
jgi:hypothetical protein